MDQQVLAQLVSYAGLLAATAEYCEIIRRRRLARASEMARHEMADSGLRGLVRVLLIEER